uniref:RING-type domain-containing protein n=1 Tax=Astyanax mexicanus TaxID=7994 RepID=A0A3B1J2M1_ASTMX
MLDLHAVCVSSISHGFLQQSPGLKMSFQCSICLDVFTDPVTTPCGHNFCMVCLREFWNSSSHCQCPVCKEETAYKW